MGDGREARFWEDRWLASGVVLYDVAMQDIPNDYTDKRVVEFVDEEGRWDLESLRGLLPDWVLSEVANTIPADESPGEDRFIWQFTPDDSFSTKSAYNLVAGLDGRDKERVWKKLWKGEGHQRTHCFVWKVLKGGLPTNALRFSRHQGPTARCPVCDDGWESDMHILRECREVKKAWRVFECVIGPHFFELDRVEWIEENLFSTKWILSDIRWSLFFGCMLSAICISEIGKCLKGKILARKR